MIAVLRRQSTAWFNRPLRAQRYELFLTCARVGVKKYFGGMVLMALRCTLHPFISLSCSTAAIQQIYGGRYRPTKAAVRLIGLPLLLVRMIISVTYVLDRRSDKYPPGTILRIPLYIILLGQLSY